MADKITYRKVLYWLLFTVLSLTLLLYRLLPLDLTAGQWPGPDWILALAFAWVLRRPSYVPTLLVAVVMFVFDLLLLRAPGLWTALSILGLEFLRSRSQYSRDLPFLAEWAMVAGVILAITLANRVILAIFLVNQPGFALDALQAGATVLLYPFVALASTYIFGVRKSAPGEVDQLGHRI